MVSGDSPLMGIVQAYDLDPEKQYQLKLGCKNEANCGAIGSVCPVHNTAPDAMEFTLR